ncbi:MAG: Holliday junction resolvase RuvX, partial [Maribacter dokdonensis]
MGKILAIDYGEKRIGLAVTDDMKMIAFGLTTIATPEIFEYLAD